MPDGTCSVDGTAADCATAGGEFDPTGICDCEAFGACCRDGECSTEYVSDCTGAGAVYQGDGIACAPDLCAIGACCADDGTCEDLKVASECPAGNHVFTTGRSCGVTTCPGQCCAPNGTCTWVSEAVCAAQGGKFDPDGVCDGTCVPFGACCLEGECTLESASACTMDGGIYQGDETACVQELCAVGTCCAADGSCADLKVASECQDEFDEFSAGKLCGAITCRPRGACCLPDDSCEIYSEQACIDAFGVWQGPGVGCSACTAICIVASDPPTGAIDARTPDGGWTSIEITFSGNASGLTEADFEVTQKTAGSAAVPFPGTVTVTPDSMDNTVVVLTLDDQILPGAWTSFKHTGSGTSTCLGYLSADAGQDRVSGVDDIGALVDCLNEVAGPCEAWVCDIDRLGSCTGADLARLIDLLNGAGAFGIWDGATIDADSPCVADPPCVP